MEISIGPLGNFRLVEGRFLKILEIVLEVDYVHR